MNKHPHANLGQWLHPKKGAGKSKGGTDRAEMPAGPGKPSHSGKVNRSPKPNKKMKKK